MAEFETPQPQGETPAAQTYLSQRLATGEGEQVTPAAPQPQLTEIPQEVQQALIELAVKYEQQCDWMTRGHKRQLMEAEEFWKGNHYGIWDESQFGFWDPQSFAAVNPGLAAPRYDYINNLYKVWGKISINAVARVPKVRARPASAKSEKDIATAKAFDRIANLIERNNHMDALVREEARLLYVQGGFGSYVRFLRSEEYGVKDELVTEMRPTVLREAGLECWTCGAVTPQPPQAQGLFPQPVEVPCPQCGAVLTEQNAVPEEVGEAPQVVETKKVPEGREVISTHGLLELKILPHANSLSESPYLIRASLYPTSSVRASWPLLADKIGSSGTDGQQSTYDALDARYQAALVAPPRQYGPFASTGSTLQGMVLLKQAWFRPSAFFEAPAVLRQKLLQLFPDGVHFNYVGKLFLNGANENMDKFWKLCIGEMGNGIYRGGTGQDGISINKRINDVANIQQEYVEHAAFPTVFGDARFISAEGWQTRRQEAGSIVLIHPEHAGHQINLKDMVYQPTQKLDGNIYQYGASLSKEGEYITGALPTVAGGGVQYNETLGGFSQAREDALGRLRLVSKVMREHHAGLMELAVECFRANRTEDAELSVIQKSGEFASEFVRLDEIQGNVTVEPETDEDFPATTGELRENISKWLQNAPEIVGPWLTAPQNTEFLRRVVGDPLLVIPAEAAREKTFRDIFNLVEQEPQGFEQQGDMQIAIPSVMPELFVDDHLVAIATVKEWCLSSDPGQGIEIKKTKPLAYANVVGYLMMHISQMQQEQSIMNPQPQGGEGGAGDEAAPPPAE